LIGNEENRTTNRHARALPRETVRPSLAADPIY
jgi:hypothetical protein